MYMQLYDHLLRPITNFKITWPDHGQFTYISQLSQIAYFLSRLDTLTGSWAIISHPVENPVEVANEINNSNLVDGVIVNFGDHAKMSHFNTDLLTKPYVILNNDYTKASYHPFWLVTSHYWAQRDPTEFPVTRKYQVGMLSQYYRPARVYLLIQLANKPYYNEVMTRWGSHQVLDQFDSPLTAEELSRAQQLLPTVAHAESVTQPMPRFDMVGSIQHGIDESYLNIVLETYADSNESFVSEKIFKPIRAGQLFLVQGSVGSVELLRKLGFDVYDDFIEHDFYDNDPDWRRRTDLMLEVLDRIYPNIETIYQRTLARRMANAQYLRSPELIKRIAGLLQVTTHRPLV
jgi:hypothetical protein